MTAQITPLPTPVPSRQDPDNFAARADAFLGALPTFATEANLLATEVNTNTLNAATSASNAATSASNAATSAASAEASKVLALQYAQTAVNAPGTSATSTTSHTLNLTSPKTFQIQTGKQFGVGQFVIIAYTLAPQNYFLGQITAHDNTTGTLTVSISSFTGSGTFANWTISLAALQQTVLTDVNENTNLNVVLTRNTGAELLRDSTFDIQYNPVTNTLIVPNIQGSVTQAAKLTTPRTITATGDVTGSVSFDGSANVSLALTIQPDSVALGTDTTGNYVGSVTTSGVGITASSSGAEGGTTTITSNATSANTPNTIVSRNASGDITVSTVNGNLNGNAATANQATNATNVNGGTVSATTGTFSGNLQTTISDTLHTALGNVTGTVNLSFAASNYYSFTVANNISVNFIGTPANTRAAIMILEITNGGAFTVTWPSSVKWPSGTAPNLTLAGVDLIVLITDDGGINYRATRVMADSR